MKLKRKIILIIAALILGVLVLFGGYSSYNFSSVCAKCLQHASVYQEKMYGLTFLKWNGLKKNPEKILRSTGKEPNMRRVSADLYREIFDKDCRHYFVKGGFGAIKGFALHIDGVSPQRRWYRVRLEMIEALYAAYVNTGSKELARKTYELIDREFPIDDEKVYRANNILKLQERIPIKDLSQVYP
jgi:hypothetical protein